MARKTPTLPARSALSPAETIFVNEYLSNGENGTKAYQAAFPVASPENAGQSAHNLLKRASVQYALASISESTAEAFTIDRDIILREINRLATFDVRKLFRADGSPKEIHELDDDSAAALSGLEFGRANSETYIKSVKIASKGQALDMAMKHLGLYERDNSQGAEAAVVAIADFIKGAVGSGIPVAKRIEAK